MIPLSRLSEKELDEASRRVAGSFKNHPTGGIFPALPVSEKRAARYFRTVLRYAMRTHQLYAVSENGEGYCVYCRRSEEEEPFFASVGLFFGVISALGIEGFSQFTAMFMKAGESAENRLRQKGEDYIGVSLLAVSPACQGRGYMRQMLEEIFRIADDQQLPVVLQTDTRDKMERYCHLGMRCTGGRNMGYGVTYYDLIRDPKRQKD